MLLGFFFFILGNYLLIIILLFLLASRSALLWSETVVGLNSIVQSFFDTCFVVQHMGNFNKCFVCNKNVTSTLVGSIYSANLLVILSSFLYRNWSFCLFLLLVAKWGLWGFPIRTVSLSVYGLCSNSCPRGYLEAMFRGDSIFRIFIFPEEWPFSGYIYIFFN